MSLFKTASGLLGMNARNLSYISKYNSKEHKRFADDKIFTKQFLESRDIGVAKLYRIVNNHQELTDEFFSTLPPSFVIKPNRGFAGEGIVVINEKKGKHWITISGKRITRDALEKHCLDILEGKYSISGTHDKVIFEEKLDPHESFRALTTRGLPDIRVIVFNFVPVMAMLRVPTPESDGKANMELGAIAMGIDMGTGKTTGGALYKDFIKKLPNGDSTSGFQVPFWDEILHSVSKIQHVTKIGFVGVDIVVTRTGVKVLEVNARPGLKIQIANRTPLRSRLEKVSDLKVLTPEDGVEIAKTLFSTTANMEDSFEERPVIGSRENVLLNSGETPQSLEAKIDLGAETNYLDPAYMEDEGETMMDITLANKRLKLPVVAQKVEGADIALSGKYLSDFYIDPNKKFEAQDLAQISARAVDEKMIRNIDEKICDIDQKIKLLSYINPKNITEQRSIFLSNPDFSPRFFYRELDLDVDLLRSDLTKIPVVDHQLYPLYDKKIQELDWKLQMLEARDSRSFGDCSKKVYGGATKTLYRQSLEFIQKHKPTLVPDESELLDNKKSIEVLENFLKAHKLSHWKIKILEDSVADIQVTKKDAILLKKGVKFRKNRLEALLVHEIGTHVFRFENGKVQPLRILERGTANCLRTEEGLAVWNQNQLGLDLGDKFLTPAYLMVAIYMAGSLSFVDLFHYLKTTFDIDDELAWKLCIKSKRGLGNTEIKTAFTKDTVYFAGLREIEKYVAQGGTMEDLYVGKITTDDLKLVSDIDGLRPAKFLL